MIEKIQELLKKKSYSKKIQERLENDLEIVSQRLLTGQYEYHDYSEKNTFRVDERTRDFFLYLKSYAESGYIWKKILSNIDIHKYGSVVDLCCGWAPKVTLGLFYLGYKGKLVLFDQNKEALDDLESFMNSVFRPKYTIEKVCSELEKNPQEKYGCIIANHIFDDILLDRYCKENHLETTGLYSDENYLKKVWGLIEKDSVFLEKIPKELAHMLDLYILDEGIICLSQYESMMENILDNHISVHISISIMHQTIDVLKNLGYTDISDIGFKDVPHLSPKEYYILKK